MPTRQQPRDRWLRHRPDPRAAGRSARLERTLVHVHAAILVAYAAVTAVPLAWQAQVGTTEGLARPALAAVFAAVAVDLVVRGERLAHLGVLLAALGPGVALESLERPGDLGSALAFSAFAISGARLLRLVPFTATLLAVGALFAAVTSLTPDAVSPLGHVDGVLLGAALSISIAAFVDALEDGARAAEQLDEEVLARERTLHHERSAQRATEAAGRVLHDEVLTSLRLVADGARRTVDTDAVRASCEAAARLVREQARPPDPGPGPASAGGSAPSDEPEAGPEVAGSTSRVDAGPTTCGEVLDHVTSRSGVLTTVEGSRAALDAAVAPGVADAMARAVGEALRNVERHSGTRTARLRVRLPGDEVAGDEEVEDEEVDGDVVVEVVDHGRGLGAEPHEGFGLRRSVRGTVEQAGGRTELVATPGGGLTVRLHLPRPPEESDASDSAHPWSGAALARSHRRTVVTSGGAISLVRGVAWPQGLVWTYLALRYSWRSPSVLVMLALLVVLVVVTLAAAVRLERRPPTPAWVAGLTAVLVGVQAAGLAALPAGGMLDYRSWTVGFVAVPVMTLCFFLPRSLGLLVIAPHPAVVLLVATLRPDLTRGLPPLGSLNATVLTPLLGVVLGGLLRRSGRQVETERERLSRAERTLARRRARAEVSALHLKHTREVVVPWLEDVAGARVDLIDPRTAETARTLSWEVRDDLYAPGFFDATLRRLVSEARRRGAVVEVGAGFAPGAADRATGLLLRGLAPRLRPGTKLTVATRDGHARVSLVPPDPELVRAASSLAPDGLVVDVDEFRAVLRYDDAPPIRGLAPDRRTG